MYTLLVGTDSVKAAERGLGVSQTVTRIQTSNSTLKHTQQKRTLNVHTKAHVSINSSIQEAPSRNNSNNKSVCRGTTTKLQHIHLKGYLAGRKNRVTSRAGNSRKKPGPGSCWSSMQQALGLTISIIKNKRKRRKRLEGEKRGGGEQERAGQTVEEGQRRADTKVHISNIPLLLSSNTQ